VPVKVAIDTPRDFVIVCDMLSSCSYPLDTSSVFMNGRANLRFWKSRSLANVNCHGSYLSLSS
jgi:hypothetical protein